MDTKSKLQIFETADAVMKTAGNLIIGMAEKAIAARGRFVISLSGGNTPGKLYSLLSQPPYSDKIQWAKVFVFWGDERCVPLNDTRNNAKMTKSLLLDKIDIPAQNIYPVPVNLPPVEAAKTYEETLHNFFGKNEAHFDLILLGLGENGHTASLFPGTPVIHQHPHWVKEVYVEEQKMFRITMTASFINQSRNIVFLVTGAEKAGILKTVLTGSYLPDKYPAQLIKPENGDLYWLVDKNAYPML